jgi:hypothetical protein
VVYLEELDVWICGLGALPEGIGLLVGLRKLDLFSEDNIGLQPGAAAEGLWCSLVAWLEELGTCRTAG